MPLEIKELQIRVNVENPGAQSTTSSSTAAAGGEPDPALVQACVDKVLEVLTKKSER